MDRFTEFVRERRYLHNVSPATVSWYTHAFKWLPSESPTQDELKDAVLRMREKGLKETGCNAVIRAVNAYLHWSSGSERKCGAGCSHPRIAQLKEPQNVLPTLTEAQIKLLVSWKPKPRHFYQRRLHLLALLLLDTGCRITEQSLSVPTQPVAPLSDIDPSACHSKEQRLSTPVSWQHGATPHAVWVFLIVKLMSKTTVSTLRAKAALPKSESRPKYLLSLPRCFGLPTVPSTATSRRVAIRCKPSITGPTTSILFGSVIQRSRPSINQHSTPGSRSMAASRISAGGRDCCAVDKRITR